MTLVPTIVDPSQVIPLLEVPRKYQEVLANLDELRPLSLVMARVHLISFKVITPPVHSEWCPHSVFLTGS